MFTWKPIHKEAVRKILEFNEPQRELLAVLTHFGLMAAPQVTGHVSAVPLQPPSAAIGAPSRVAVAPAELAR